MNPADLLVRLAVVALAATAFSVAWLLLRRRSLASVRRAAGSLPGYEPGKATVVLFTSPSCGVCKAAQRPALAEAARRHPGEVRVLEVDAVECAELARRWSVLTVPTTFVLDRTGTPRSVNHGFAPLRTIEEQLALVL